MDRATAVPSGDGDSGHRVANRRSAGAAGAASRSTFAGATILKLLAAAALVWMWLRLVQLVLVLIVAVLLAVTLNPIVEWFERRGWPRWRAALLIFVVLLAALGGFGWLTWNSVSDQASFAASHFSQLEHDVLDRLPAWVRDAAGNGEGLQSSVAGWALRLGQSAISALVVGVLGLILTMYLVVEAQATTEWVVAFVPKEQAAQGGADDQRSAEA